MKKHVASVHVGKKPLWNNFILLCTLYDQILIYIHMFIYFGFQLLWILNIYANSEIISFYWIILKSNMNIEQKHFISSWRKKRNKSFPIRYKLVKHIESVYEKKNIHNVWVKKTLTQTLYTVKYKELSIKARKNAASVLRKQSTNCLERKKLEPQYSLNSQYFWKWTNANPMKIIGQDATASKL